MNLSFKGRVGAALGALWILVVGGLVIMSRAPGVWKVAVLIYGGVGLGLSLLRLLGARDNRLWE